VFGATSQDVGFLDQFGFRATHHQGSFAMLELEPCRTEAVIQDHAKASVITVGGGIDGRNEITWERPIKPGPAAPGAEGDLVAVVAQRLCGPGWLRVRYQIGTSAFTCRESSDGRLPYFAKVGEVTRVRCTAPEL
jgi:hypothetical protein